MSRPPSMAKIFQRGPRLHRRIDVAEVPFVRGQCAVGMLEPFPAQQAELVLGECRVDVGQGDALKRQIPCREPRVLPGVGHRHDVERLEVAPAAVADVLALLRRRRLIGITVEPPRHVVVVELLAPQQPGERLAHHRGLVR
jgi:hypothetical protein